MDLKTVRFWQQDYFSPDHDVVLQAVATLQNMFAYQYVPSCSYNLSDQVRFVIHCRTPCAKCGLEKAEACAENSTLIAKFLPTMQQQAGAMLVERISERAACLPRPSTSSTQRGLLTFGHNGF